MADIFLQLIKKVFRIRTEIEFEEIAIEVFNYQYNQNAIYRAFCNHIKTDPKTVASLEEIPFLPISFFKTHQVITGNFSPEVIYTSSGTSGMGNSKHEVRSLSVYRQSFNKTFNLFYTSPENYIVIGLLPSYLEREGSSLVYMVDQLISKSSHKNSGFYLNNLQELASFLKEYKGSRQILLIGVSYALLDLAEGFDLDLSKAIIMETGGMKGRRKEMTKPELHQTLQKAFNIDKIHSEYGMTELLSQAYSKGHGQFKCPPWVKVLIREYNDPFSFTSKKSGGINMIDLANLSSCAFIATDDLGRIGENYFEVLGRFDNADLRGCNLLVQ
ncbi:MAG: acyl transferase [Crocinitomicaceae bacterium]